MITQPCERCGADGRGCSIGFDGERTCVTCGRIKYADKPTPEQRTFNNWRIADMARFGRQMAMALDGE